MRSWICGILLGGLVDLRHCSMPCCRFRPAHIPFAASAALEASHPDRQSKFIFGGPRIAGTQVTGGPQSRSQRRKY